MHVCTLCEVIFKTSGLLVVLSLPPDSLSTILLGPHGMLIVCYCVLGAHTVVFGTSIGTLNMYIHNECAFA